MIITKSVTIAYDSNLICRGYTISRIDNPRVFKGYIILPTKKAIIAGKIKDCGTDFMEMDFVQFFSFMGADWGKGKLSFNFKDRKYKEAVLYEGVVKERGNLRINTGFFMKVIDDAKRARILEERTKKNIESISRRLNEPQKKLLKKYDFN